ncbi:7119_t:CDS:2 [Funneliformis caledonium]|uniref:7119_t:CDS:1 n=1 Tax=Funneliformis caledonium TaxID=1117310 RepID=A0A9N9J2V3_9GLOM|nr:7119_t:CDS:2 [Funneliformis caledonium]
MMINPDSSTQRDSKRLKNINLTEAECLMYSILAVINQKLIPDDNSDVKIIDLTSLNTVFDDDVSYEDILEDKPITE